MMRTLITWTVILAVVVNGNALAVGVGTQVHTNAVHPDPDLSYDRATADIDAFMDIVREMRSNLDRSQFDLGVLIDKLEFDSEAAIEFVRTQIAYEQYSGLLRGAQGTLMSRAGNALDQSVLLATLLKDAGYDARIARTTLTDEQIRSFLQGLAVPRTPAPPIGNVQRLNELVRKLADGSPEFESVIPDVSAGLSSAEIIRGSSIWKEARRSGEVLVDVLSNSQSFESLNRKTLQEEAADYFWVQYRSGPAEDWVDAHPTVNVDWQDLKVEQVLADSIAPELQHRVSFQAFVSQKLGEKINVHPVMAEITWPAANLLGKPIVFSILPMPIDPSWDWAEAKKGVLDATMFFPTLNGSIAGDVAFDINGFVVPTMAAASPFAALFQTVSGKVNVAAGALSGLNTKQSDDTAKSKKSVAALDELYFEISHVAPNGSVVKHKRTVLAGGAGMTTQDRAMSLFTEAALLSSTGSYPDSFVIDLQLQDVLEMQPKLQEMVEEELGIRDSDSRKAPHGGFAAGFFELYEFFDIGADALSYRDSPSIVVFRRGMDPNGRFIAYLDIVANGRRTLDFSSSEPALSLFGSVNAGVWETQAESAIFKSVPAVSTGAMTRLRLLNDRDVEFSLISDKNDDAAEMALLPGAIKAAMERELQQGYVLVSPAADTVKDGEWAWWRIDPKNGSALGVLPDGTGASESADYTLLLTITLGVGNFIADGLGRLACEDPTGQSAEIACKNCTQAGIISGGAGAVSGGISAVMADSVKEVVDDVAAAGLKITVKEALKRISVAAAIIGLAAKMICAIFAVGGRVVED